MPICASQDDSFRYRQQSFLPCLATNQLVHLRQQAFQKRIMHPRVFVVGEGINNREVFAVFFADCDLEKLFQDW